MEFDVIVVGLGAMGSAAAHQLATRGQRVLGLDRFQPPHEFGSSHGRTRIIREAYYEDPLYVPLVQRAYELWAQLEKDSGRSLLLQTGGLMIGRPEGALVSGALRSATEHRLPHEILSAKQVHERFPALKPNAEMSAVWEPRAGILFPELAIQAQLDGAARRGACLRFNQPVEHWEPRGDGVQVQTAFGSYSARRLLVTSGAWVSRLVPDLNLPLSIERQFLCWFEPLIPHEVFAPGRCPIHLWEDEPGKFFYGFPNLGDGVKLAVHHEGEITDPDRVRREVDAREVEALRARLRRLVPDADGPLKSSAVCLYTNTPDHHFILDFHPGHPQVLIASPCSGHGFKFSSAIGELAALLLGDESPPFNLDLFKLKRFGASA